MQGGLNSHSGAEDNDANAMFKLHNFTLQELLLSTLKSKSRFRTEELHATWALDAEC